MDKLKILDNYSVLNIQGNIIYAARGYKIFKSFDNGESWSLDGRIRDGIFELIANGSRLLSRLLRTEITTLLVIKNGTRIAIGKKSIFIAKKNENIYLKTFHIPRGTRPLNICEDKDGNLYFGEYFSNPQRKEVHIYCSKNFGESWEICYTFPAKSIRHIHGVFYDKYKDKIWFVTGDFDQECVIGFTRNGFNSIEIFKEGKQKYRAVGLLFFDKYIIYGTDTEYEKNYIYKVDRDSQKEYCLQKIQGSVLSAINSDKYIAITTAVEPSSINKDTFSYLWISRDGDTWEELFKGEKDLLSPKYFQYGRFKLPIGGIIDDRILFSGHALIGMDNKTINLSLDIN